MIRKSVMFPGTQAPLILLLMMFCLPVRLVAGERPNFILILSDDQSWVGTSQLMDPAIPESKSDLYHTPNFERIAGMGMRFTNGYAPAPYCCPTRRALQVGLTPALHIYQADVEGWPEQYRNLPTLPRMLKQIDSRYKAAHFGKWDMRFDDVTPEALGYDVSDGTTTNGTGGARKSGGPAAVEDPKKIDHITRRSCRFMAEQAEAGNPFYLQVSHYAVHLDIYYRERTLQEIKQYKLGEKHTMHEFAAMTLDLDTSVGTLLDKVQSLGLSDNTYIIYMSDNGGRTSLPKAPKAGKPLNHPLREGKGSMYEGGLRVPFLVVGPGIQAGSTCDVPVTGLDIFPTLADLAGNTVRLPEKLCGGSLRTVLKQEGRGTVQRSRDHLIFHQAVTRKAQSAIRQGNLKLLQTREGDDTTIELFDLSADPGETRNLAESMPVQRDELSRILNDFLVKNKVETRRTMTKKELKKIFP